MLNKYFNFLLAYLCLIPISVFGQNANFYKSTIILDTGSGNTYYDAGAATENADFNGNNLGIYSCNATLVLNGGETEISKGGGCDVMSSKLAYRIYLLGSTTFPAFSEIDLPLSQDFGTCFSGNSCQRWAKTNAGVNILSGLANGNYKIEVYFIGSTQFCSVGSFYDNNFNNNYSATFTISNPITITTNPSTSTVCFGSNTTLTASATGNDAYIWQKQNGASWINVSNGSLSSGSPTILNLTNVTSTEIYRCLFTNCGGINTLATQTVTVAPQRPTISLQPISQSDCDGNVIDFNITVSAGNTFTWQRKKPTDASYLTVAATTNSVITNTITTSQLKIRNIGNTENPHLAQFQCVVTDANSCTNTTNVATLSASSIRNIADSPSICERGTTSFTTILVGTLTAIKWQKGTSETAAASYADLTDSSPNILGSGTTTLSLANIALTDNNTFYRVRATFATVSNTGNGTCTQTQSVTAAITGRLTVIAAPTAPAANSASRCDVGTVVLSATSILGANESFRWYDSNVSSTVLGTNASYTTGSLAVGSYMYYLSVYNSLTTCESIRTPVIVVVNPLPTITLISVADICNSGTIFSLPFGSITNSPNQYSISIGSPELSGFSAISNATLGSPPINVVIPANATPNTYQFVISVKNSITTCVSSNQSFTVKINSTPSAPIITSPVNFCQNVPTSALTATAIGTNSLLWYGTSSGGGKLNLSAPIPSSNTVGITTYFVSQLSNDNCESTKAAIDVIVNAIPAPPSTTTTISYCKNSTANILSAVAAGSNSLIWYDENDNILGSAPTPNTTIVGTQIFKVSQKSPYPTNCESTKTSILVTIFDLPIAPTVTTPVGYCQNATATSLSATVLGTNTLYWYGTNALGGTSSGTAPTPITTSVGTKSYYVSQKDANNCESLRAKIDVEITPSVSATISGINAFCITGMLNKSTTLTANPTGGNGSYTYQWQNLAGNIFSATSQTYEVNSTVQAGNSDTYKVTLSSGNCIATANMSVTKQGWSDVPSVSISPTGEICGSGSKTISVNSPNIGTYRWYSDATNLIQMASGTSFSSPNLTSTTSYYVAREHQITANLTCQTVRTLITINVNPIPSAPTVTTDDDDNIVCAGANVKLSVSDCLGTVIWSNGTSATTITVSASGTYNAICIVNGCKSLSSSTQIIVVNQNPTITLGSISSICNAATNFNLPFTATSNSPSKYSLTSTMSGFVVISDVSLTLSPISVVIPSGKTGNHSFTISVKNSSTNCINSQTFNLTVLPVLLGGSLEVSSSTVNCSGYNAGVISSVNLASGGKIDYIYQWQSSTDNINFTDISGANLATYDPPAITQTMYYRRKVIDACGAEAISSNVHQIQIVPDPQITIIDVTDRIICTGGLLNLQASVIGGSGTCTPTWQSSSSQSGIFTNEQVGGLNFSATVTNTTSVSTTKFFRVIYACSGTGSGSCNQGTSSLVKVIINPNPNKPTITPFSVVICPTQSTTLTASGCGGIIIWNVGQTGSILSVSEAGTYSATCSLNGCLSAKSSSATITLASGGTPIAPPVISGTTTICSGQVTNLLASNCSSSVIWSNGVTGNSITVNPSISTDYTAICFDGTCTSSNSNKITITVNSFPNITTQPKNEVDCNGNSVTFSVTASSITSYQWQRKVPNGTFTNIDNAISNTLKISNIGSSIDPNQTEYRLALSNQSCSVTSTVAVLTVNSATGSLADKTICEGANISFNLANMFVSGNIQSYQWQRRVGVSGTWNDIVGATASTLTINVATNADEQYYRCKINFTTGSSTCTRYTTEDDSNGAKLTVLVASTPTITGGNSICKGKSTILTANNCDGTIAWSSGQSTGTITVSPTANTSYTVSCTSTQCGFSVVSAPYVVSVNETLQPEIITYDVITPKTLTFAARTTVPNATLMWYNRASGGTGTIISPSFSAVGTYSYWVTQTDPITGCESSRLPIIAKVFDYFHITQQPRNQVDCRGNSVYLGVVAVGPNPTFIYQWQRKRPNEPDFVNLVEEGNGIRGWYARTMAISNVGDINNPDQTQYRCIVGNDGQFIISDISTLTVNSLEGSMPNFGICVGGTNEFNLQNYFTIKGNVVNYQWQTRPGTSGAWTDLNDGNRISGSNKSALKFTNATYEQGVFYRCLVKFNTQGFECTESTDDAKLIVSGFPPAPEVSSVFYCQNANAVRLKVDSPIQNLVWYSQEIGGVGNTTTPTPNTNIAGFLKYYVSDRTDEGCEGPRATINIEIGATPTAPKNTTPISVNEGNLLAFSAEGNASENQVLRWYTSPTISTFSTIAPIFTESGTYTRYVAQVSAFGCVGPRTAISATIIPNLKFTKQPISQADCEGNSVTFSVSAIASSIFTYQWQRQKPNERSYTNLTGENANVLKIANIGGGNNPNLSKYRCLIKDDRNNVISDEVTLTVNQIIGTMATMSLCEGKESKLTFSGLNISGKVVEYQWQRKVGNTYVDITTKPNGVAIINEIGTYRGKITFIVDKNITCSRTTEELKVEIKPTPTAPQAVNQNACLNIPFDVTKGVANINSLNWYKSATDSTADKITPKIDVTKLGKTTFFVSQINAFGCESERKSFDIMVSEIPEKPITNDLSYCRNAPSLTLVATTSPQNKVLWYASQTAKEAFAQTPKPSTKLDGEVTYFATTKNIAGCESERALLKVLVAPCIANFESNFNNCLQVSADSVKGNQWFDLYDKTGCLYASVNSNGQNLGKVSISIRHFGRGSAAIPQTQNDTKLMSRYADFQSSLINEFDKPVSLRIYYLNDEFNEYKTATNLPNLTINDFNIVHYDGIREDCGFENNDNFAAGESSVIYKNVKGNQIAKDFFYLQFDVNEFSENGATANNFAEIILSGKETENQTVQLNWQSKYEIKAEKYIVERSSDCKDYTNISEVKANSMSSIYEYIDFQPLAGKNCYRLVYIDKDGIKKYLDTIEVNFTDKDPVCSVFTNHWAKGDEINLYLRNIKEKEIKLFDMRGQKFPFSLIKNEAQIIKIRPDIHLSKGIHFVAVIGEDGKKCVQKVMINP